VADVETRQQLGKMITGYWVSQAVYVAAKLELADKLATGAKSSAELARATNTHDDSLFRLLRALASVGIFRQNEAGKFELTPLAEQLRREVPGSQWAMAIMMGEEHYRAYGDLLYSVRTGRASFEHVFGMPVFEFLSAKPQQAAIFDAAMTSIHGEETQLMAAAYDWSSIGTLVDVGGGNGSTLIGLLQANPKLRGVLFDLPHVVERARVAIEQAGLKDRCELVGGSFFERVPPGADAYVMRHIIHDWDDSRSVTILSNCRKQLGAGGRVLIVESVVPPGNEPAFSKWLDLTMLTIPEGRERTEAQYRDLLAKAGLSLTRIVPTQGEISVLEAHAA
jgi:predicted O-methyltransferase YrrM